MANWTPPRFDRHQFQKRSRAVSARYTPEGWETNGLGFSDFALWNHGNSGAGNMHICYRERVQERRLETPSWAVNDAELREVLLKFCERRLWMSVKPQDVSGLTQEQRIERIRQKELERAKQWQAKLIEERERYKTTPEERKYALEVEIQNLDTQILICKRGNAAIAAAVCYLYFRLGYDSPTTANELGLKPPHVRQILARLHLAATGTVYRSPNPKWNAIREFRAELRRMKKLFSMVKRVTEECNRKQERKEARLRLKELHAQVKAANHIFDRVARGVGKRKDSQPGCQAGSHKTRWTRAKVLFIHFHLLAGVDPQIIARRIGIKRPASMRQGYRYFLANPQRLRE